MGYGGYSHEAHETLARSRASLPKQEVFTQRACHPLMDPKGVKLRESRDSAAHPHTLAIVFALDVTGSMGHIPDELARKQLPSFMKMLMDRGVQSPQILFMAVGDAIADNAPLQVGQFESAAKEMDQWLTWTFLEGGGGGTLNESYELGFYFLARHTEMDCMVKRKKRGYLFMTGDEPPYPRVSKQHVSGLIGDTLDDDLPIAQLVAEVARTYHPFFLIPDLGRRDRCERVWRDLLGDHVICMEDAKDTCHVAAGLTCLGEGIVADLDVFGKQLRDSGVVPDRVGAIVRALSPYAAALGRDGAPLPELTQAALPTGETPSGYDR